jgi:hypothetical protein
LFAPARRAEYAAGQLIFGKGHESRDVFVIVIVQGLVEFFLPRPKAHASCLDEGSASCP